MAAYDEVIAGNVRARRSRLGIGQERLAARMRALGYSAFLRQTVSKVEKGERRLTAAEVNGLAWALETSIAGLMTPTADDKTVEFPSGGSVSAESAARSVHGDNDGSVKWDGDVPVYTDVPYPPPGVDPAYWVLRVQQGRGED